MTDIGDGFDVRSLASTFGDGAVLDRHRHPWGQLVWAKSGVMHVATDDVAWLTPATRAIWLPPEVAHQIRIRGEVAMRTLYISPSRAAALSLQPAALEVAPLLRELILHILGLGMLRPDWPEHDRLAGLLIDLVLQARVQDLALPLPRDLRAASLAAGLQARPDQDEDLAGLAREAGASLRTLQRIFPVQTGLTLQAWRRKARLIHSISCLGTGASVTQAALDSGYQSVGAFITAFERQFGVTPGRYLLE